MKKIFNKKRLSFLIMFLVLFIISFYMDIYTRRIFDITIFNFNNLRSRTIWLGFTISWILIILFIMYFISDKKRIKMKMH